MIKQHVVLSGFASEQFTVEIDVLQKLRVWLDRFFPPGTLTQWTPAVVEGHNALEFGNRLFTPSHLVDPSECLPISSAIDPSGTLQNAVGKDLAHTEDNVVRYFHMFQTQPFVLICFRLVSLSFVQSRRSAYVISAGGYCASHFHGEHFPVEIIGSPRFCVKVYNFVR